MKNQKKPSILEMLKNFAKEVKDFAKEGAPHVSEEDYEERLTTCASCEFLKEKTMRCGSCGCVVEQKAKWATASCPEGFWKKQIIGQHGKTVQIKGNKARDERIKKLLDSRKRRKGGSQGDTATPGN